MEAKYDKIREEGRARMKMIEKAGKRELVIEGRREKSGEIVVRIGERREFREKKRS